MLGVEAPVMGKSDLSLADKMVLFLCAAIFVIISIPAVIFISSVWILDEIMQKRFGRNYEG